jgi:hypothetical protein
MTLPNDVSNIDLFRAAVREWLPAGLSDNQMLQSARELGFGIRRANALGIISGEREAQRIATEAAQAVTEITAFEPPREYRWGTLTHETDQFLRFDGPHALLFQVGGDAGPDWSQYVVLPEDSGATQGRFVVEEDEPSDPNDTRNGPYYRTTGTFDIGVHPSVAMQRMGLDPGRVVRILYDLP